MFMAGGRYQYEDDQDILDGTVSIQYLDDILEFDEVAGTWQPIGKMRHTRSKHAMSVVNFNEVKDYCI